MRVRNHLSKGMHIVVLRHTEMVEELAALWAAVSSTTKFMLGRLPNEAVRVEVVDELIAEFQRQEEWCSFLERPGTRVCDLILGLPSGRTQLGDWLEEVAEWLKAELAARREADATLEASQALAARIQDLVLGGDDGLSSLAASLSSVVELLEGHVDAAAANGVRWGTR
jgi:hypothetical protein